MSAYNSSFSSPQVEQALSAALLHEKSSYNITQDKKKNYASLTEAIAAVSDEKYKVNGLVLTFYTGTEWVSKRYNGADASGFATEDNWVNNTSDSQIFIFDYKNAQEPQVKALSDAINKNKIIVIKNNDNYFVCGRSSIQYGEIFLGWTAYINKNMSIYNDDDETSQSKYIVYPQAYYLKIDEKTYEQTIIKQRYGFSSTRSSILSYEKGLNVGGNISASSYESYVVYVKEWSSKKIIFENIATLYSEGKNSSFNKVVLSPSGELYEFTLTVNNKNNITISAKKIETSGSASEHTLDLSPLFDEEGSPVATVTDEFLAEVQKAVDLKYSNVTGGLFGTMIIPSTIGNEDGVWNIVFTVNVVIQSDGKNKVQSQVFQIIIESKNVLFLMKDYYIELEGSGTKALTDDGQYAEFVKPSDLADKADKVKVESGGSGTVNKQLNPNTLYEFGECTSLTITLAEEIPNIYNEYMFEFTSGTTPTTLSLPETIGWMGSEAPTIEANKTYQCSIVNNIAVIGGK